MSRAVSFPWTEPPAPGAVRTVAPGILWARLPLPFRLNHVNVWLIEEDDGWTVIDTGCNDATTRAAWEALFAGPLASRPVTRLVATHGHVDHIGLAGWMVDRFGCRFVGTLAEWLWARIEHVPHMPGSVQTHRDYLLRNGFDADEAERMIVSRERYIDLAVPLPGRIEEIRHGETVRMGGRDWTVIVSAGHAYAHAGFHDPESGILIAGDQLLPDISPVIAVYETTPSGDPLGDFLTSFAAFEPVTSQALVLPSHGLPYRGASHRIAELEAHHDERLSRTVELLSEPMTVRDLTRSMFPKVHDLEGLGFAVGEVLAHVNHLVRRGRVVHVAGPHRAARFVRALDPAPVRR